MDDRDQTQEQLLAEVHALRRQVAQQHEALQRVEAELGEQRLRYRELVEDSIQGLYIHQDGMIQFANRVFAEMFGYDSPEALVGLNYLTVVAPHERARLSAYRDARLRREPAARRYEFQGQRRDGELMWLECLPTLILWRGRLAVLATFLDITERKQAAAALERANAALRSEIETRRQAEDEVRRLNAQLEQRVVERTAQLEATNRELEAFSYSVSHDLRAPLRAIDGFSRILLDDYAPQCDAEAQRYLSMIGDSTQRMGQLIEDLLTFSRVGRRPLSNRRVAVDDLARQALEELRYAYAGRQVEVAIGDLPACQADPILLKQVLVNLLANALKFTRQRPVARVEVSWSEAHSAYFVRDNGVGFDMRYASKLFVAFQRLHGEDDYEGTGVGLSLAQRIVCRHGGRIWAEAAVDGGATFYFTLAGESAKD